MVPHWPTSLIVSPGGQHSFQGTVDGKRPAPVHRWAKCLFNFQYSVSYRNSFQVVQDFYHPPWSLCPSFLWFKLSLFERKFTVSQQQNSVHCLDTRTGLFFFWVNYYDPMYLGPYFLCNSQDELQETLCKLLESHSAPRVRSNPSRHHWNDRNWTGATIPLIAMF